MVTRENHGVPVSFPGVCFYDFGDDEAIRLSSL